MRFSQRPAPHLLDRFQAYREFAENFLVEAKLDPRGLFFVRNLQIRETCISILCLNTAWLSTGDFDKGQLALGELQVKVALDQVKCDFRICLMHHPFSWLRDHEIPVVHGTLARACDLVLSGHLHIPTLGEVTIGNGALLLSAGALHMANKLLSYNLVHLDLAKGRGAVYLRLFTGLTPDWSDHDLSPSVDRGRLRLRRKWGLWRWDTPSRIKPSPIIRAKPELQYPNLFRIASYAAPYIVLLNSLQPGLNEYRVGDIETQIDSSEYELPAPFRMIRVPEFDEGQKKCRLLRCEWVSRTYPFRLSFHFAKISYGDYLKSGEHLDDPLPGRLHKTFRDEYAPQHVVVAPEKSRLTNICGVGIFIVTRDNKVIVTQHSKNVAVLPQVWSYSSSGTMDWGPEPHPFREVVRECREEIGHQPNLDDLVLFGFGIDAKKLYFQFSFLERTPRLSIEVLNTASHARDRDFEMSQVVAVPFDLDSIVQLVTKKQWEPAAAAALLTLCAKEFGQDRLERAVDPEFVRQRYRDEMIFEWGQRASRPGDLPVMSARYPTNRLSLESRKYVEAVMRFNNDDVRGKNVLEIGAGNGRITERLFERADELTCIDLSEEMLALNRTRLGENAERINYIRTFAQDYSPQKRHDVVVSSLVLIHNVDEDSFRDMVDRMCACADTIFLFEHIGPSPATSASTQVRSEHEVIAAFSAYSIEKRSEYLLFNDRILFLKLVRKLPRSA